MSHGCYYNFFRGGARNFPTEGLEPPTRGAKMAKKCSFCTSFWKISSDKSLKFPPSGGGGGLDASAGDCYPLQPAHGATTEFLVR